ncbi:MULTISPECIES: ROK family transcriptional regulator [unclassified Rathayibacter]|uniref:ROK family transcriptional regulator n=1 Tax=unclassified Rathayibacter TaxID=2609250 RepID=UPI0006F5A445|nr:MULTISPECIES: ROK family transcriptional regulator [unclassified Rathayibacter]KQQ05604.1 ROK family transcriptional regulator [Rathayibacter sp. Leaf294]KQS13465.1 ROK family transcriptional regulator [Rathayibacter sp. Leaf185]
MTDPSARAVAPTRVLRPTTKRLPQHGRVHNRALVLQTLYSASTLSRADIARRTGLTRVTISNLVAELIVEGLVVETGQREDARPGKPATLLEIDSAAFQIIGIDLSDYVTFRGGVLDLDGRILERADVPLEGATADDAFEKVVALCEALIARSTSPLLGIGIGSPGIVDPDGVVVTAPNLGWFDLPLQLRLTTRFGVPVVVTNDANAALLAEFSFGETDNDMMLVKVGHGVGAGLLLGGAPLLGSMNAAGEIGHVVSGLDDDGLLCVCGKVGCLETWVAGPRLESRLALAGVGPADSVDGESAQQILREAGRRLGLVLAPIVGVLNLTEIILSGPEGLLGGVLLDAATAVVRARTMATYTGELTIRLTTLGQDIVIRGSAVTVLSRELGFS